MDPFKTTAAIVVTTSAVYCAVKVRTFIRHTSQDPTYGTIPRPRWINDLIDKKLYDRETF